MSDFCNLSTPVFFGVSTGTVRTGTYFELKNQVLKKISTILYGRVIKKIVICFRSAPYVQ